MQDAINQRIKDGVPIGGTSAGLAVLTEFVFSALNDSAYSKDVLKTLSPMGTISDVKDIVEAVVYLTDARQVTGEVLHVDGGAHSGKW